MGYKVYTGLVYDAVSAGEVVADAARWRDRVAVLAAAAKAAHYARAAVEHLDDDAVGAPGEGSPLDRVESAWREDLERDRRGYRHPATDLEFLITLHAFEGRVYGLVRTERGAWFDEYLARPGVREYRYWDNVDRPKDATAGEWDERRRVWSGILRQARGGDAGRDVDCSVDPGAPSDAAVEAALPSFEARLERVSRGAARDVYVREVASLDFAKASFHDLVAAANAAQRWLETDAGAVELNLRRSRLAPLLAPKVTADLLRARPSAGPSGP